MAGKRCMGRDNNVETVNLTICDGKLCDLKRLMGLLYVACNVKTEGCLQSVSARQTNYVVKYDFLFTAMKD